MSNGSFCPLVPVFIDLCKLCVWQFQYPGDCGGKSTVWCVLKVHGKARFGVWMFGAAVAVGAGCGCLRPPPAHAMSGFREYVLDVLDRYRLQAFCLFSRPAL